MKTTKLLAFLVTLTAQLHSMNICLMHHDEQTQPAQQLTLSADAQKLSDTTKTLNLLMKYDLVYDEETKALITYEPLLETIEQLAASSQEQFVKRNAHFILGTYAYQGYIPHYGKRYGKLSGVNFKKALEHFQSVVADIKTQLTKEESTQQAEAYLMMGKIHQQGESCLFGCVQTVKVSHQRAAACFLLAQAHAEENSELQIEAALAAAMLN